MKKLDNMTIRVSWTLVLAAFSLMLAGIGGLGLYANHYSHQAFATLNQINVEQARALNHAYIDMLRARVEMDRAAELIRVPSFDRPEPVIEQAKALLTSAEEAFSHFLDTPAQAEQQDAIETLQQRFYSLLNTGLSLQLLVLEDGDVGAYRSGQSRVSEMSQAFMASADEFFDASAARGRGLSATFTRVSEWMSGSIIITMVASLVIAALVLWGVTRNVIRPLRRAIEHFRTISAGDLTAPIEQRGSNEIGQLFHELATMQRSLATLVARLREGSDHVLVSAQQMSLGNQELSSRTQQQSASLEQIAASLDELTTTVAGNADSARQADRLAGDAALQAREGNTVISEFVDTMDEIHERSKQIGEIIGLIDDIAFQTNILALNASVEAARAGDQGKGFAVVAGEVRTLASRSADAANQIRGLIAASRNSAEQGNALSARASAGMQDIVLAIQEVSTLMEQIANASQEQHLGIGQLNQAMSQMESVTQDNARLVELASRNAHTLEEEAKRMGECAARFTATTAAAESAQPSNEPDVESYDADAFHWQPRVLKHVPYPA
ncbi:methyl-accepting chemotaxis protein [Litchfieldella qijiaojingensis]|uniref:Methyl-accepting chemotaxis protein n=1 Tax=Litchfieldella qijiaojingensis TaxID=980347 RepID=A0ABQ2YIS0_9GAMM|nr:methyl-accepting chemotaxis protein [Halomonas qijiaojingensis]GGX82722.1 methyl-accepting chemotaxis protein [Halomonas qijiaojingensis]